MKLFFTFLFISFYSFTNAQFERSNWHFGPTTKGLLFPSVGPPNVTNNSYTPYSNEGCMVASDALTGTLLFYSDGIRVVDANHNVMPNGSGLLGMQSSAGSGIIVDPQNCNRYYIFYNSSVFEISSSTNNLYYSIVDMTLPGNGTVSNPRGDIVTGMKNIQVNVQSIGEAIEVIPVANSHEYWILVPITPSAISVYKFSAGVVSHIANYPLISNLQDIRSIKYNAISNKLAVASMIDFDNALVMNFNTLTGAISNQTIIPGLPAGTNGLYYGIYDLAWSPNGTKLYISKYRQGTTGGKLYQYDLTTSTTQLIYNVSTTTISNTGRGLEIGPDGKIYFLYTNSNGQLINIGAVNSPNNLGVSCGFTATGVNMGSNLGLAHKFPKFISAKNDLITIPDTTISIIKNCSSSSDSISISLNNTNIDSDGDNISYQVISVSSGSYASYTSNNNILYINNSSVPYSDTIYAQYCDNYCFSKCKTFKIVLTISFSGTASLNLPNIINSCAGTIQTIDAGFGFNNYLWSTGDTTQTINIQNNGIYNVSALGNNGCLYTDTINVIFNPQPIVNLGNDTSSCGNISIDLNQTFASVIWSTGNLTSSETFDTSGSYYVNITDNNGCSNSDSINITIHNLPSIEIGNDTSLCNLNNYMLTTNQTYSSILWSTGDTSQQIIVQTSDLYYVIVSNNFGCVNSDSIFIEFNANPLLNIGNDTTVCSGINIQTNQNFPTIYWNNGDTTQITYINTSGLYFVNITDNNGCYASDSINIIVNTIPFVNTGNDTVICGNSTITISLNQNYQNILWNTGDTTNQIIVNSSGIYIVVVSDNNNCSNTDSIIVTFNQIPTINIGPDTTVCGTIILNVGQNYPSINWSTGSTSQFDTINTSGLYSVTIVDANGCTNSDTINININSPPSIGIGGPYYFCSNSIINQLLYVNNGFQSVTWSNGSIGDSIYVTNIGTYSVTVVTIDGCIGTDTTTLEELSTPISTLPQEYYGCPAYFNAGNASQYSWSTNATTQSIYIETSGIYSVILTNNNGCTATSTITVNIDNFDPNNLNSIPNVFTPNGDNLNDYYTLNGFFNNCNKLKSIIIYNRWGQKIFETEDSNFSWDGKINGQDAPDGVYFAIITSEMSSNIKTNTLHITLLR